MRIQILPLLGVVVAVLSLWIKPVVAQTSSPVMGTWFGSIVLTKPDGKVSHETAVMVITEEHLKVSGGMGRTIDQMTPWQDGSLKDGRLMFHLEAAGGLDVILTVAGERLAGTAIGQGIQAKMDLRPAPGLLPHQQLEQEIALVDRQTFEAFGNCDVAGYASFLSRDLEFYQDHTGETGYEENLKSLRDRCAEGIHLRRELEPDSLVVNAAPGFDAIQAGTQRFYSRGQDGQEHLDATARFTNVWSKKSGDWKLVRVISYDHR